MTEDRGPAGWLNPEYVKLIHKKRELLFAIQQLELKKKYLLQNSTPESWDTDEVQIKAEILSLTMEYYGVQNELRLMEDEYAYD